MQKRQFKELYPHLAEEIEEGTSLADVSFDSSEEQPERKYQGYEPGPMDFLRRCSTKEQATEIIDYLEKRGEISKQEANEFRSQLKKYGLKAFGKKKQIGFYEK
jgi:hypothetical protein